ncbi:GIY-YIG nuclease family protein, partial [Streptomyces albipurpureus]|uniref:GIY-YIG nuclease family protein n=1 Tax=Streptomyces albipurpureus TaxID=2897419 RepID=UPI0031F310DA
MSSTASWVYLAGSLEARPVRLGTGHDTAARLREMQTGSPVRLHLMWCTRAGQDLERALLERFAAYRVHGPWLDFGDEHPVALVATAAVLLGHTAYPNKDTDRTPGLTALPHLAEAKRLAALLRQAFATAGDPPAMPLTPILDYLRAHDPATWNQWNDQPIRQQLGMAGRTLSRTFRSARLDLASTRLSHLPTK